MSDIIDDLSFAENARTNKWRRIANGSLLLALATVILTIVSSVTIENGYFLISIIPLVTGIVTLTISVIAKFILNKAKVNTKMATAASIIGIITLGPATVLFFNAMG
ncbi:MAG: hypothetical protein JKY54_15325 [Flavobacteriales bacterium]|nr:hypothetical protein [Flavobacteriales bacterium]